MKIKTYNSDSVTKALEKIKKELGPDAVIVNTRRVQKRKMLGLLPSVSYEITAAVDVKGQQLQSTAADEPDRLSGQRAPRKPGSRQELLSSAGREARNGRQPADSLAPAIRRLGSELAEVKRMLKQQRNEPRDPFAPSHLFGGFESLVFDPEDQHLNLDRARVVSREFRNLVGQGFRSDIASSLIHVAFRRQLERGEAQDSLGEGIRMAVKELIRVSPTTGQAERPVTAAFVGPTGVGKTTTVAKLAAVAALGEQKRVQMITLDTYRIAAAEQLKIYGEIIGVPVRVVSTVEELEVAIADTRDRDVVLIDTTGHSHRKVHEFTELAAFLGSNQEIEKHLVLTATTKSEDLRQIVQAFEIFRPDKVLFTKLDETSSYGSFVSELITNGKPLSYLTDGQNVPEDLRVPTAKSVADLIVPLN